MKNVGRIAIVILFLLLCGGGLLVARSTVATMMATPTAKPSVTPTVVVAEPLGYAVTWVEGQSVEFYVPGGHVVISDVDGIGLGGLRLRGQSKLLHEGDVIQRLVDNKIIEFGRVVQIDVKQNQVTVFLYKEAQLK